jgi:hypothetical protein
MAARMNKYTRWLIVILIVISIGILMKMIFRTVENDESTAMGAAQNNSGNPGKNDPSKSSKAVPNFNISQVSLSEWNTPSGLPYTQVPGANLGPTSFAIMDENRIAFLCNSSSDIIITNKSTGKSIERFQVSFAPRDFVYEKGFFYVLFENVVKLYNEKGIELTKFPFPSEYQGVEKLLRSKDATFLLLPSGNSLLIEKKGKPVVPIEYSGYVTGTGQFITAQIVGDYSYSIKALGSDNKTFEKTITTYRKVAGAFVIGATDDRIILDIQTFISENPIAVERTIASVSLNKNGIESFVNRSQVPDCYYVISNKDFYLSEKGEIFNMVTTPQGVLVFLLTETKSYKSKGYSSFLSQADYHSNENLIKLD